MMNNTVISKCLQHFFLIVMGVVFVPLLVQAQTADSNQTADPASVMKVAIEDVLAQLKAHETLYQTDPEQLRTIVAKSALLNFYIKRMAQLALAKHWRSASVQQREIYVREFQRYLMRTYTTTLYLYRNTSPEMLGGKDIGDTKSTLKLRVKNDRGEAVMLFLRLEIHKGAWKIVDINVEGVSLVITARGLFDEEINRVGIDTFLKNMTAQNDQAALNKK
jgi:phospholipid transport system substrate-binding protein